VSKHRALIFLGTLIALLIALRQAPSVTCVNGEPLHMRRYNAQLRFWRESRDYLRYDVRRFEHHLKYPTAASSRPEPIGRDPLLPVTPAEVQEALDLRKSQLARFRPPPRRPTLAAQLRAVHWGLYWNAPADGLDGHYSPRAQPQERLFLPFFMAINAVIIVIGGGLYAGLRFYDRRLRLLAEQP
jgi:hypothetical protein